MIEGKTSGLKASQVQALERVYRRKIPANELITGDLARYLTELSRDLQRQVGVIIDRAGTIQYVIVGDDREIVIPGHHRQSGTASAAAACAACAASILT